MIKAKAPEPGKV